LSERLISTSCERAFSGYEGTRVTTRDPTYRASWSRPTATPIAAAIATIPTAAHSVSFVSVTKQFNTTTSMGRLTLL
jgi:hypothetical protein